MCPGHQFSEFVPWLINNSSNMTHGQTFDNLWTDYTSSYGEGWEPIESHWTIANNRLRGTYKKVARIMQPDFPSKWFELYMKTLTADDVRCVYVNNSSQNIPLWTQQCRAWFTEHYPDCKLEFAGHKLDLLNLPNPSLYFIKEGYILDDKSEAGSIDLSAPNLDHQFVSKINAKHEGRGSKLQEAYDLAEFEYVTDTNTIVDKQSLFEHIAKIVTPPNNYDDLVNDYWSRNQPNSKLDDYLRTLL